MLEFECLCMLDIADYDSTNGLGLFTNLSQTDMLDVRSIFQVEETSSKESSNNVEDGDNDGEGWGITNHYVLFIG